MGLAYGQSVNAGVTILTDHQIAFDNDVIVLSSTEPLDLSSLNSTAQVNSTQTIGTITVDLTQQVTFVANNNDVITLENIALPTVSVEIPDQTTISGPELWDNTILPPVQIPTTGNIPSGFQTPDNVIQVGSADVILIFDKTVTIILEGVTGQTAYKLPGENTWNLIDGCDDEYDDPTDPTFPNECSISNGIDTKIVTYHFTEFGEFEETSEDPPSPPTTTKSGGHGRTGVGPSSSSPGQVFVPSLPILPEGVLPEEEETKAIPVPSPTMSLKEQLTKGVAPADIVCKSGLELHLKLDGTPTCIRESTFEALMSRGYKFSAV